jgi:hypothetical protein
MMGRAGLDLGENHETGKIKRVKRGVLTQSEIVPQAAI